MAETVSDILCLLPRELGRVSVPSWGWSSTGVKEVIWRFGNAKMDVWDIWMGFKLAWVWEWELGIWSWISCLSTWAGRT